MSLVGIFCKQCGNDGSPGEDGRGGFEANVMSSALVEMNPHVADEGTVIGHEPVTHPLTAIFEAAKNKTLTCRSCGSHDVEVICEADQALEREEQKVLDTLDVEGMVDNISSVANEMPVPVVSRGLTVGKPREKLPPIIIRTDDDIKIEPFTIKGEE